MELGRRLSFFHNEDFFVLSLNFKAYACIILIKEKLI